jgi:hypothetical protein
MTPRDTETPRRTGRPPSGGPAISARSRIDGAVLGWCDGQWSGDEDHRHVARGLTILGDPLELRPGCRPVTPADGDLVYAAAVVISVLGPVDWAELPEGFDDEVTGGPLPTEVVA